MSNTSEILRVLKQSGVTVSAEAGRLKLEGASRLTPELKSELRQHKSELLSLLDPQRTTTPPGCPEHWRHIPELPDKGEPVVTTDARGDGLRYRCCLFDRWTIIRFCPNVSETQVRATSADGKHYELPSMDSLYRALWAETYAPGLRCRETN